MTMPVHLVLVRHGQSEWNVAQHRSRAGDHSLYTPEFRSRHSSTARLTDRGREQAKKAGEWLRERFARGFTRMYVSPYARAMETAALLDFPNADWYLNIFLRERDGGALESLNEEERRTAFAESMKLRQSEPFFWTPPNGESMATICGRVDRVLDTLHRECADKSVVIVLHGEMMWGFRASLEHMSPHRFKMLHASKDPKDRLHNGQILHYTRLDEEGDRHPYFTRMRSINPMDLSLSRNDWEDIVRPKFTNEDLLEFVEEYPRILQ